MLFNTSPSRWNMNNAAVVGSGLKKNIILLKAAHIAGAKNVLANHLRRIRIKPLMVVEDKMFLKVIFSLVAPSGIYVFQQRQTQNTDILPQDTRSASACKHCAPCQYIRQKYGHMFTLLWFWSVFIIQAILLNKQKATTRTIAHSRN